MTIASQTSRISYVGNGATTAFAVPFYFAANADLAVYLRDAGGNSTLQVLGTNYNLSGATLSAGGTCTFVTAPASTYSIVIYRDPALTQTTSYNNNDPFPAKSHELALDKALTIDQRTRDIAIRSVHLSDSDSALSMVLPTVEQRKGKVAGYDPTTGLPSVSSNTLATLDSVLSGALATSGGFNRIVLTSTLATLKATTPFAGAVMYMQGYAANNDGGGGVFIWNSASTATDNGGTIIQPNAGGVGRWIRDFTGPVNVRWFGAKGDGVADDTTAIQAAVTAVVNASGGIVYLPSGTYKITSAINIDGDAVQIVGEAEVATTISLFSAAQNGFVFGNGATTRYNVGVRDLRLIAGVAKTAGAAIHFNNCGQVRCQNIRSLGQFETVRLTSTVIAFLQNMYLVNPVAATGRGIFITGSGNDQYLQNVLVAGNVAAQPETGIYIEATGGVWLDTVGAIWSGVGLRILPGPTQTVENVFSRACAWDTNNAYGVYISAAAGTTIRRVQSLGDWFTSNTLDGLVVVGAGTITDIDLVASRAYNNGNYGLRFEAGSDISLVDPHAAGNSQALAGTYHGIIFNNALSGFSIVGGRSRQFSGFGNTQGYGIVINSAAADNYIIDGIDVRGNSAGSILTAAALGPTRIIKNCLGYTTEADGSTSATTDASGDIVVTHGLSGTPRFALPQLSGAATVGSCQPHTYGPTTFKVRFWNTSGAALATTAVGIVWRASL